MMLTYGAEVVGLISLVLVCVATPLTAVGLGAGALMKALRQKRGSGAAAAVRETAMDGDLALNGGEPA